MRTSTSLMREPWAITGFSLWRQLLGAVGALHCRLFHKAISRPVGGKYRCWKCLREFELEW